MRQQTAVRCLFWEHGLYRLAGGFVWLRERRWCQAPSALTNTVYFCLRYENSKGEAGPFGPVLSAVIP
jgi:hypothetical protein